MKVPATTSLLLIYLIALAAFGYRTQNAVILVIDGSRYTETFGDSTHQHIPRMWNELRPLGTIYTRFYNDSITTTCSGHSTIVTGTWQNLANDGSMRPMQPTVFEYFRRERGAAINENYVILGKPKLAILAYGNDTAYGSRYAASVIHCNNYADDMETWANICTVLTTRHPRLAIANLGQVDAVGHGGDWPGYLASIRQADSIVGLTWDLLQKDPFYKDRTTLFVTNDHGRHTDYFADHGDHCEGCRHLLCMMIGPDAAAGVIDSAYRRQTDIAPTVGELFDFSTPLAAGAALIPVSVPAAPILTLPADSAVEQPLSMRLQWQPVRRAASYRVQVALTSDFFPLTLHDTLVTQTSATIRNLSNGATFYWRVNAQNRGGSGEWSEVRRFVTENFSMPEVRLLRPENDAMVVTDTVSLEWSVSTTGVTKYWIEIAADPLMKERLVTDSTLLSPRMIFRMPRNNFGYWWRVRAAVLGEWAQWSRSGSFRAQVPTADRPPETYACFFKKAAGSGRHFDAVYALRDPSSVSITAVSPAGRRIKVLFESHQQPGNYTARVDLGTLPGGCYLLDFKSGAFSKRTMATVF